MIINPTDRNSLMEYFCLTKLGVSRPLGFPKKSYHIDNYNIIEKESKIATDPSNQTAKMSLTSFTREELAHAWISINGKGIEVCREEKLELIIYQLYHDAKASTCSGSIPLHEKILLDEAIFQFFANKPDEKRIVTLEEFVDLFCHVQQNEKNRIEREKSIGGKQIGQPHVETSKLSPPRKEFTSYSELNDAIQHMSETIPDPHDIYRYPATTNQEYGWYQPKDLSPPKSGRKESVYTDLSKGKISEHYSPDG
jgi:hypothetical protein